MAKAFFIKTFGCQMNLRDSEIMAQTLSGQGFVESMSYQDADLIILNTCSIRAKAEQKVLSLLGYLRKTKSARPGMALVVAGCVAQQEGARLLEKMPHVDLVIGTQHIYGLPALLEAARQVVPASSPPCTTATRSLPSCHLLEKWLESSPCPTLLEEATAASSPLCRAAIISAATAWCRTRVDAKFHDRSKI